MIDNLNDPSLRSFIEVAPDSPFPIQNLPFGFFSRHEKPYPWHVGVAIGDYILDMNEASLHNGDMYPHLRDGIFDENLDVQFLMWQGKDVWRDVRRHVSRMLRHDNPWLRDDAKLRSSCLIPRRDVEMRLPCRIENYTDFYSSREHATNVGIMLRGKDNALMPNWTHLPVAYHGRASSVVVSGTDVKRPNGQTKADDADAPTFGPSKSLDFELELGLLIGQGNDLGQPISAAQAPSTFSAWCWSTTGAPAIFRSGNISRSGRSWRRILPPRYRRGW